MNILDNNRFGIVAIVDFGKYRNIRTDSTLSYTGQYNRLYEHDFVNTSFSSNTDITKQSNSRLLLPKGAYEITVNIKYEEGLYMDGSFQPQVFTSGVGETEYTLCHHLPTREIIKEDDFYGGIYQFRFSCVIECLTPRELGLSTRWFTSSIISGGSIVNGTLSIVKGRVTKPAIPPEIGNGMPFTFIPENQTPKVTWNTIQLDINFNPRRRLIAFSELHDNLNSGEVSWRETTINWSPILDTGYYFIRPNQIFTATTIRDYGVFIPFINYKSGSNLKTKINKKSTIRRRI